MAPASGAARLEDLWELDLTMVALDLRRVLAPSDADPTERALHIGGTADLLLIRAMSCPTGT